MAFSRRDFLKRTCCTAAAGFAAASFNRFGLVNALAQSAQDYKALVCVFLFGGNDSNNMVVPLSSSGYASYQQIRSVLALPQGSLLPITPPSAGSFGFHPKFTEDAGPVQPEASGGAGQRGHAGSPHHPGAISAAAGHPPAESFLARRPAGADADRRARRQRTDRMGGENGGQDPIHLRRELSPLLFRWREPIFFAKGWPLARFSPAATPPDCSRASAVRPNPRAGCPRCRTC